MALYIKSGNSYQVTDHAEMDLHDHLPAKNYVVKKNPLTNEHRLFTVEDFEVPSKLYGNTEKNTKRILNTFFDRSVSTGVLLSGEKGSGKSLLAKNISIEAAKQNIPTIIVNSPLHGDGFNALIQKIDQPCVVLFDEFEKVYEGPDQEAILTLLDGVFPTKKLFILTSNDKWRIDSHMRNRPGRIYYFLEFSGVDEEFVAEYCNDNLVHKEHAEYICKIPTMFEAFNFDMLKAIVEEVNRYNESPQQVIDMLNIKHDSRGDTHYDVSLVVHGKQISNEILVDNVWYGNPLAESVVRIDWNGAENPDEDGYIDKTLNFGQDSLVAADIARGIFTFKSNDSTLVLKRRKSDSFDYRKFL